MKEHLISIRTCKIREGRLFNVEERQKKERQKVLLQVLGHSEFSNKRELESQTPGKQNLVTYGPFSVESRQWITAPAPNVTVL